jgi:membrane protease YdiL (CAAX protease family)
MKHKLALFYVFAFAISWTLWYFMYLRYTEVGAMDLIVLALSIGGAGPIISLAILEKISKNEIVVDEILNTIRLKDTRIRWFLLTVFVYPLIIIAGNLMNYTFGPETQFQLIEEEVASLGILVIPIMIIQFCASLITSPFFEEPGWRGYALVNLQEKFGREGGSLVVGVLWWVWHQPMNLTFGILPTIYSFLFMVTYSFMIDSLFNLSDRNLLIAMFAHQSVGTAFIFIYAGNENLFTLLLLTSFVIMLRIQEHRNLTQDSSRNDYTHD